MSERVSYFRRDQACEETGCRSKLFYEQDGFVYCKRDGHQQEGIAVVADDGATLRARGDRITIRKEKTGSTGAEVSPVFTGRAALSLYLQCYQLILWRQCYALRQDHVEALPVAFEHTVKHLWRLRLSLLQPRLDRLDEKRDGTTFTAHVSDLSESAVAAASTVRKASLPTTVANAFSASRTIQPEASPTLLQALATLYIAATLLLRLPLSLGRIHALTNQEVIPFIRAIRHVPLLMQRRLGHAYSSPLDLQAPLSLDRLKNCVREVVALYQLHFDKSLLQQNRLSLLPLNVGPLLLRHLHDLALPLPWIWPGFHRLSAILQINFAYPTPVSRVDVPTQRAMPTAVEDGPRRRARTHDPELTLMALIVIVVKLMFPFPEYDEHGAAEVAEEVSWDWAAWTRMHHDHQDDGVPRSFGNGQGGRESSLKPGSETNITPIQALSLTTHQQNQYLDWYERMYIDSDKIQAKVEQGVLSQDILDLFPLTKQYSADDADDRQDRVMDNNSQARRVSAYSFLPTPCSLHQASEVAYQRYENLEEFNEQPENPVRTLHQLAAEQVGCHVQSLLAVIRILEFRLMKVEWEKVKETGKRGRKRKVVHAAGQKSANGSN